MIIKTQEGLLPQTVIILLRMFLFTLLLLGITLASELCTSDVYDSYLEAYPMKCGSDCDEYKKWEIRREMIV